MIFIVSFISFDSSNTFESIIIYQLYSFDKIDILILFDSID